MTATSQAPADAPVGPRRLDGSWLLARAPEELRDQLVEVAAEASSQARRGERLPRPAEPPITEELRAHQRTVMASRWGRTVPDRFREATLDGLDPDQDPDGRVTGWLERGGLNLLLVGAPGAGKTHAAYAIGHAAAARGLWAHAVTAADLNNALRPANDGSDTRAMWMLTGADVLILDDLGRERITEWTIEQLWRVVDTRSAARRRTVWTTNLPYDERGFSWEQDEGTAVPADRPHLIGRYGASVVDRILDDATVIPFRGRTRRRPSPF